MLENIRRNGRNVAIGPVGFIAWQLLGIGPLAAPIWIIGLYELLFGKIFRPYRALGFAYLASLLILLLTHGRFYYLAPSYSMLLAAGSVAIEGWQRGSAQASWLAPAYTGVVVVAGLILSLNVLPLLPPQTYVVFTRLLGFSQPKFETRKASDLPQFLADRCGWAEVAAATAKVYNDLPANQKAVTAIFGSNYGEAGAIDFYGPALGLPPAISGHVNYWYWGPRNYDGANVLVLGGTREKLEQLFENVEPKAIVSSPHAMASENFTIYLCSHLKGDVTLEQIWPKLRNWN